MPGCVRCRDVSGRLASLWRTAEDIFCAYRRGMAVKKQNTDSRWRMLWYSFQYVDYRNRKDQASFAFRMPEGEWQTAGKPLEMVFTLDMFVGYRIGIFCYGLQTAGGYADFRDFSVQEL